MKIKVLLREYKLEFIDEHNGNEKIVELDLKEESLEELNKLYDFILKNIDNMELIDKKDFENSDSVKKKVVNSILNLINKEILEIQKEKKEFNDNLEI